MAVIICIMEAGDIATWSVSPTISNLLSLFPDGSLYKEVTPKGLYRRPFMLVKDGKYYFMWSEGDWTKTTTGVAYAIADSPFGPFERVGTILESDPR